MSVVADLLLRSWELSARRLADRCMGLSTREYLWRPVPDAWTLEPDLDRPGRWTYQYDFAPPPPAPVTSIGWRLVHLIADNEVYWEHAFGPGKRTFPDLEVAPSADRALELWNESREPVTRWLADADDAALLESRPSHLGSPPELQVRSSGSCSTSRPITAPRSPCCATSTCDTAPALPLTDIRM